MTGAPLIDKLGDHRKPSHDTGGAVEIAAMRYAVEMRADDDCWQIGVVAGERQIEIAGGIDTRCGAELFRFLADQLMGKTLARTVSDAGYARCVGGGFR